MSQQSGSQDSSSNQDLGGYWFSEEFHYVGANAFATGRDHLKYIMILRGEETKIDRLDQFLDLNKQAWMWMVIDYDGKMLNAVLQDADFKNDCTVFVMERQVDENNLERDQWLARALLPSLLLTALNVMEYREIKIEALTPIHGHYPTRLFKMWDKYKCEIVSVVSSILSHNELHWCLRCEETCPYKRDPWHLDLSRFNRQEYRDGFTYETLDKILWTDKSTLSKKSVLRSILEVTGDNELEKFINIQKVLHDYSEANQSSYYATYLVLAIDGHDMSTFMNTDKYELVRNQKLTHMIYVGKTTNQPFRMTHFTDPTSKSSINEILTSTTRMFMLRNEIFDTSTEVEKDEAFVIQLLMNYRNKRKVEKIKTFVLLNKIASKKPLGGLKANERTIVQEFEKSGVPIYRTNYEDAIVSNVHPFPGNFELSEIRIPSGDHQKRSFADISSHVSFLDAKCYK